MTRTDSERAGVRLERSPGGTQEHVELAFETSTMQSARWAAASGDFDPIHYDRDYAVRQRLPGVIVNGRLKLALLARLAASFGGPGGSVRRIAVRHLAMDAVGEQFSLRGVVTRSSAEGDTRITEVEIWVENPRGERTSVGSATVCHRGPA